MAQIIDFQKKAAEKGYEFRRFVTYKGRTVNLQRYNEVKNAGWPIKWAGSETGETGKILLKLGGNDPLPDAGLYYAEVILFSADHPNGIYWSTFPVSVES